MPASKTPMESIEQLRKRYEELHKQQITADANYLNAQKALDEMKTQARNNYGTDDLETLRARLAEMEAENARRLAEYQAHLDKIEADLKDVSDKFRVPTGIK